MKDDGSSFYAIEDTTGAVVRLSPNGAPHFNAALWLERYELKTSRGKSRAPEPGHC